MLKSSTGLRWCYCWSDTQKSPDFNGEEHGRTGAWQGTKKSQTSVYIQSHCSFRKEVKDRWTNVDEKTSKHSCPDKQGQFEVSGKRTVQNWRTCVRRRSSSSTTKWATSISREWFDLESPNLTRTSIPSYYIATPYMKSLATSGRTLSTYHQKHCQKCHLWRLYVEFLHNN